VSFFVPYFFRTLLSDSRIALSKREMVGSFTMAAITPVVFFSLHCTLVLYSHSHDSLWFWAVCHRVPFWVWREASRLFGVDEEMTVENGRHWRFMVR